MYGKGKSSVLYFMVFVFNEIAQLLNGKKKFQQGSFFLLIKLWCPCRLKERGNYRNPTCDSLRLNSIFSYCSELHPCFV